MMNRYAAFTGMLLLGLALLTGCQNGGGNTGSNEQVFQKGWYIKLTVQSSTLTDSSTVLGYLQGASDGKDRYDSEAINSGGRNHLYTTLYRTDWGDNQHYRSDYRAYKETGKGSESWTIVVTSSDTQAEVTLSWNGITYVSKGVQGGFKEEQLAHSLELEKMRLIDTASGSVMPATRQGMQFTFNMNGATTRTLTWVLLSDEDPEPTAQEVHTAPTVTHSQTIQTQKSNKRDYRRMVPPLL